MGLARQVVLTQIGREEEKAQVVDVAVVLPRLKAPAERASRPEPRRVAGRAMQQPEDAGKEALAPVRPALAFAIPLPADGVHRQVTGILLQDAFRLAGGKIERLSQPWQQFRAGGHHFSPLSSDGPGCDA